VAVPGIHYILETFSSGVPECGIAHSFVHKPAAQARDFRSDLACAAGLCAIELLTWRLVGQRHFSKWVSIMQEK
jgi:hypothetical protein